MLQTCLKISIKDSLSKIVIGIVGCSSYQNISVSKKTLQHQRISNILMIFNLRILKNILYLIKNEIKYQSGN